MWHLTPPPPGNLVWTVNKYNLGGLLIEKTDNLGGKTTFAYDNDDQLITQYVYTSSSEFNRTEYQNNHLGKVTNKKVYVQLRDLHNGAGTSLAPLNTSYAYDANGNVLVETNPDNVTTTYTYDNKNQLLTSSQPGVDQNNNPVSITNSATYNYAGYKLTEVDPNGNPTSFEYDKRNNLIKKIDQLGGVQYTEYDRAGRITAQVAPNHYSASKSLSQMNRTVYQYDLRDRLLKITEYYISPDTDTVVKSLTYDAKGRVIMERDALGNTGNYGTSYEYDPQNRVTKIKDPVAAQKGLSYTQLNQYDGLGRLVKSTDARGTETVLKYNDQDRLLEKTVDGKLINANTYDIAGNKLSEKDGNNNTTSYTYNAFYQIRSITLPRDSTIGENIITYQYSKLGLLTKETDSLNKQIIYTYDNQGRTLSQSVQSLSGNVAIVRRHSKIDANVRLKQIGMSYIATWINLGDTDKPAKRPVIVS